MRVTVIPIVIGGLGPVPKGFERGLDKLEIVGGMKTIQIIAILKPTKLLRRVLEIRGHLLSLIPQRNIIEMMWKIHKK